VTRTEEVYSRYSRDPRKQRAWAAGNPGNVAIRDELLAAVLELGNPQLRGTGDILDVGCGTGWLLRALVVAGIAPARLHGVDAQESRVQAARAALPGATIEVGDAQRLAFDDSSCELVTMMTLLSSLPSRKAIRVALAEGRRILAPGGLLLVYEPRVPNPFNRNTLLLRNADLEAAGITPHSQISLTVLPPLARRLGSGVRSRYARLAKLPPLRTHRLVSHRGG
jgi:ubiquinone/menaquinone biosynthesis C-methylase UbiE